MINAKEAKDLTCQTNNLVITKHLLKCSDLIKYTAKLGSNTTRYSLNFQDLYYAPKIIEGLRKLGFSARYDSYILSIYDDGDGEDESYWIEIGW